MAVIIRIDVDRPYGRRPIYRHLTSRFASDLYFPRVPWLGYLRELEEILRMLNRVKARAHIFFRQCTLPSPRITQLIEEGNHDVGLHLEDSRSYETFRGERQNLARITGQPILTVSKHGSGGAKFGRKHHIPYEPDRYLNWAARENMRAFFGNLEDPTLEPGLHAGRLRWFPSAFWLEPAWRDVRKYPLDWLRERARRTDVVMLIHPENILVRSDLTNDFVQIVSTLETTIVS